jgi:hypothetical protein
MEEPTPTGSLQLHEGHSSGHVSVSWARLDGNWVAITSGSDGKLVARHPRQAQELKAATNTDKAAVHCLSITQDNNMAATVDEKGYVRVRNMLLLFQLLLMVHMATMPAQSENLIVAIIMIADCLPQLMLTHHSFSIIRMLASCIDA